LLLSVPIGFSASDGLLADSEGGVFFFEGSLSG
jgi:hypothetical protein